MASLFHQPDVVDLKLAILDSETPLRRASAVAHVLGKMPQLQRLDINIALHSDYNV